jgi:acetyl-CoA carboxylase biotin carboxyl carrier protein
MTVGNDSAKNAEQNDGSGGFDLEDVRALARMMKELEIGELELRRASGERLHLIRERQAVATAGMAAPALPPLPSVAALAHSALGTAASAPAGAAAAATSQAAPSQNLFIVSAPLVGTFYRSASPDSPPFIEVGQRVRKGQTLCIIEAMKLMNELEAEAEGVIVACLADNGRPVEYGQPLFHIERSTQKS